MTDRDLQIESVEAWACSAPLSPPLSFGTYELASREYVAVRVRTSGGLVADCLALSRGAPSDVVILDLLGPVLLGENSADISARVAQMAGRGFLLGSDGIMARARSLLEICLWDLAAQVAGVPLWRLLGAQERSLPALIVEGYSIAGESDEAFAERLVARVGEGYRALKIEAASYADLGQLRRRVELVRQQVGEDVEIAIDFAWSLANVEDAADRLRDFRDLNIAWLEDPFAFDRVERTARLRRDTAMPVGAGDEVTRPSGLIDLLEAEAVDVLRADALAIGGIAAASEIAARASAQGVRLSLHIHPEIHEHCAMAWPACDHVEVLPQDRPFDRAHDLLTTTTLARVIDGRVSPPTAAGSGLRLDDHGVGRFAYRQGQVRLSDGPRGASRFRPSNSTGSAA